MGAKKKFVTSMRVVVLSVIIVMLGTSVALAAEHQPGGRFFDDDENIFQNAIEAIATEEITQGCNPPFDTGFCPDDLVTRGQMAVFLVRALDLTDNGGGDLFTDDDGKFYENAADRLATAGVTKGCNPPDNDMFCGEDFVTRGQMAAFLVRAVGYSDDGGGDLFTDDDDSVFEGAIDRLGTAGVTQGCNPPANDEFCPDDFVTRGQMAAFLTRALELPIIQVPDRTHTLEGVDINVVAAAEAEGCSGEEDEICNINQSPNGEFFLLTGWAVDNWSTALEEDKDALESGDLRLEAAFDGVPLTLVEYPFEVIDDTGLRVYSFQFPAWLDGTHVLEVFFIDDRGPASSTIRDTLTTNGEGYSLVGSALSRSSAGEHVDPAGHFLPAP